MTLDEVPADQIMTLTPELDRAFKAAGCKPECHVCRNTIVVGKDFELVSFMGYDQMTCSKCGRKGLERKHQEKLDDGYEWIKHPGQLGYWYKPKPGGGYSRPSLVA